MFLKQMPSKNIVAELLSRKIMVLPARFVGLKRSGYVLRFIRTIDTGILERVLYLISSAKQPITYRTLLDELIDRRTFDPEYNMSEE